MGGGVHGEGHSKCHSECHGMTNATGRGGMEVLVFQKRGLNLGLDIDSTSEGGFRFCIG